MRLDLDPTVPRIVIIAILIFVEGLLLPAYSVLQSGQLPTQIQWLTFLVGAILQLVTLLSAFIKGEEITVENLEETE